MTTTYTQLYCNKTCKCVDVPFSLVLSTSLHSSSFCLVVLTVSVSLLTYTHPPLIVDITVCMLTVLLPLYPCQLLLTVAGSVPVFVSP